MTYDVSIDLTKLPLVQRNKIMNFITKSRTYYKLESQVVEIDFNTAQNLFNFLNK